MQDLYKLTKEQNIFIAKRNIVDYIWKSANLENIAVTYPETQVIFEGYSVEGYKVEEITAINNLKRAWKFLLNDIDLDLSLAYICQINKIVGEGVFLNPGIIQKNSIESQVKEELEEITGESYTEKALNMMLYLMRRQLFLDGNKRIGILAMLVFLDLNGQKLKITNKEIVDLGLSIAKGNEK